MKILTLCQVTAKRMIKSQRKKKTLISEMNVIPFLESILETEGNTLKYLHFP
jgi:hypothetical protein